MTIKKKALFLHNQKTAGSSLISMMRQHYGDDMTSYDQCWGRDPSEFSDVSFVSGHIGFDYARSLMFDRFSFMFLRDPEERILSMYYFCRERESSEFMIYERANALDIEQFLEAGLNDPWVKKNIWNNQVWQLAHGYAHLDGRTIGDFGAGELLEMAKNNLSKIAFTAFTESYESDVRIICSELGVECPKFSERANVGPDRPNVSDLSLTCRELLAELSSLDKQLFAEAKLIRRLRF